MARAQEGYNNVIATYFVNTQQDHYILNQGIWLPKLTGRQESKD